MHHIFCTTNFRIYIFHSNATLKLAIHSKCGKFSTNSIDSLYSKSKTKPKLIYLIRGGGKQQSQSAQALAYICCERTTNNSRRTQQQLHQQGWRQIDVHQQSVPCSTHTHTHTEPHHTNFLQYFYSAHMVKTTCQKCGGGRNCFIHAEDICEYVWHSFSICESNIINLNCNHRNYFIFAVDMQVFACTI